ncbi:MAG: DUF6458 family protein [Acidimicrobiales bacterium]
MNQQAGSGMMVLGVVLAAIGAILAFAVSVQTQGFNLNEIGIIILIVGIVTFVVSLFLVVSGSHRRSSVREDVRNVPGGQSRLVERDDRIP